MAMLNGLSPASGRWCKASTSHRDAVFCKLRSWPRGGRLPSCQATCCATPTTNQQSSVSGDGASGAVRRLILLRHADSSSPANVRDHDRPISELGKQQAAQIAKSLQERGWVPDVVLASNAKRTKQTLDEMTNVIEGLADVDAHLYGSLYTINALDGQTRQHIEECLLEVVDDRRNHCVAVVGHNKGMEEAASSFVRRQVKLKTASAALLECVADSWRDVLGGHKAELGKGSKDEDWGNHEGVQWQLVDIITPTSWK